MKSNFNCVRVWGGGCYPDDYFYDICDELGLIVWQDFMFACAVYDLTDHFRENIEAEFKDNIIRLRNHPSLGMWCGNNEMEMAWLTWDIPENEKLKQDYLIMFERLIPASLAAYDPERFYWPSSPSSGGGFDEPYACNRGDTHYWDVWHGKKPFEDIEEQYFRFSSEYGFEAVPDIRTLRTVISDDQLNILSPQMEAHQKCIDNGPGNVTLMYYLFQYYQYPGNFKTLIYATQSLQADFLEMAIRHFRSHRERCCGSTYWQVNDTYPTVSWSTIDYYGRWKGAHYIVKKSYAPIIIYTETEEAAHKAHVFVSGEHSEEKTISVLVQLMDQDKGVICEKKNNVVLMPFSSVKVAELDIPQLDEFRERECFLHYEMAENTHIIDSGNRLLCRPKKFRFRDPRIEAYVQEKNGKLLVAVRSDEFARRVEIRFENTDVIFSDNFFDLLPGESKTVLVEEIRSCENVDVAELQKELQILSNYDIALQSN